MSREELDNLVRINRLKAEPGSVSEFAGMVNSAHRRLVDAQNETLDPDSQFDLAYGAAHRLALAALRHQGYRSENRITVFQTLVHTVGSDKSDIQIFLRAHSERNLADMKVVWKSTGVFWPILSVARKNWPLWWESSIALPANN